MHQLWVYVFGVHRCSDNQVTMFCWPEVVAKRGSDEVQSCFLSDVPPSTTTLCVYSDGCRRQNKNSNVLHYLFTLVSKGRFQQIQHTFPVRGHSYLPNDCDFWRMERCKRKHECVYTTEQWMSIIKHARVRKPFKAIECDQSWFITAATSLLSSRSLRSIDGKPLQLQKARVVEYSTAHKTEVCMGQVVYLVEEEWRKYIIQSIMV